MTLCPADLPVLDPADAQDLAAVNESHATFARFLASLFLYELSDEQIEAFAQVEYVDDDSLISQGMAKAKEYLRHRHDGTRQALAVDYAHVFLGAGTYDKIMAPPYESVFTSEERLLMQDARDGVVAHYRQFGLDLPADNTTPEDHLGFGLQFAAALADAMAAALAEGDGQRAREVALLQRSFFTYHLENWVPLLCDAVDEHAQTDFYRAVALMARGYIEEERAYGDELARLFDLEDEARDVTASVGETQE